MTNLSSLSRQRYHINWFHLQPYFFLLKQLVVRWHVNKQFWNDCQTFSVKIQQRQSSAWHVQCKLFWITAFLQTKYLELIFWWYHRRNQWRTQLHVWPLGGAMWFNREYKQLTFWRYQQPCLLRKSSPSIANLGTLIINLWMLKKH